MEPVLTYRTSFTDDSFAIYKHGNSIGKLFKVSWIGWTVDVECKEGDFRFERKGFFQPRIIVTDKRQSKEIITIRVIHPFFGFYAKAIATFFNGRELQWKQRGIFNRCWEWTENGIPAIKSTENNRLFSLKGEISTTSEATDRELLGLIGLHLRSSVARESGVVLRLGMAAAVLLSQLLHWTNS